MTFRELNTKLLEPTAQWVMIGGLVCLCQPWVEILHRYGLTITIVGLISFLVAAHIPPEPEMEEDEEEELV